MKIIERVRMSMEKEKRVMLFLILLNSQTNEKSLRIKLEGAGLRCKKENAKLRVVVIRDELDDNVRLNEFVVEKLVRWISWMYRIDVELKFISSPVPLLAAAREVNGEKFRAVFCSFGKSKLSALLPRGLRADLPELLKERDAHIIPM